MTDQTDYITDGAKRWRLVLGQGAENSPPLSKDEERIDAALAALYDNAQGAGLGKSAANVARWLGDIRGYFPASVVKIMQQDALERLDLHSMLVQPELLQSLTPDVHLAANLVALSKAMPEKVKETARLVVRKVVDDLESRLAQPLRSAVLGSVNRHQRNLRPRQHEIDWSRTIRANLRHYQASLGTVVVQQLVGYGRKRSSLRDVVLCIDQSGSMASSVVFASVFAAVLASLRAVTTKMVVFDTNVVDLSEKLQDPVDVLFGIQLGGGTDINLALAYCQSIVTRPNDTIMVLISDLYEGGNAKEMLVRAAQLVGSGVQMLALLALDDQGKPSYDHKMAQAYANLGIPAFACTPDKFPELMAALINRQDIALWAAQQDIVTA